MRLAVLSAVWAILGQAAPPAPLDGVKVPREHPRICFGPGDLEKIRANVQKEPWSAAWSVLKRRASDARTEMNPAHPFKSAQGQFRRFATTDGLECAAFYAVISKDEAFAQELSRFFEAFDDATYEKELPQNEFMPRGEFLEGLATAYDWAHPVLSEKARARLRDLIAKHATINYRGFVEKKSWEATCDANNHSMAAMGAVGLAGLALWHEDPDAPRWARLARDKVVAYLEASFDADGAAYEGNLYGPFGLSRLLPFADALTRLGHKDVLAGGRLERMIDALIAEIVPGGDMMLPLNDTDGRYRQWPGLHFLYAATRYKHRRARWVWDELLKRRAGGTGHTWPYAVLWEDPDVTPEEPTQLVRLSKGRGLLTVRTGWKESSFLASFEAGERRAGAHGQGDQGHFLIRAGGEFLAADTGYSNEKEEDSPNQSCGHNLVLVDGKGQAISGGGAIVEARMIHFDDRAQMTVAVADLSAAYGRDGYNPMVVANRAFIVMKGEHPYVIVLDNFLKDGKLHGYQWLLHGTAGSEFKTSKASATHRVGAAALDVVPCAIDDASIVIDTATSASKSFGEHPTLRLTCRGTRWLAAVALVPRAKDEAPAGVQREVKSGVLTVRVSRGTVVDEITAAPDRTGRVRAFTITRRDGDKVMETCAVQLK